MYQLTAYRSGGAGMGLGGISKNSPIRLISVVLIILVWGAVFFFGFSRADGASIFFWIVVLLAGTVGVPIGLQFVWKALAGSRFDTPDMQASTNQLQPGIELRCSFTQQVKSRVAVQHATLQLVTLEWVKYTHGTDTSTETHYQVIDEVRTEGGQYEGGDTLRLDATFRIPANAIHNFSYTHNRLQWLVVVNVGIPMWPDYYEEFELNFPAGG